jgi:peroxiredoxin Q/BCP
MLAVGNKAPHFNLPDQNSCLQNSKALKDKPYLVYFYPKDSTPGCTTQACGLQSELKQFNKLGIPVFGVSADSVARHQNFASKNALTFPLLADTEKTLIEAYGVWVEKSLYGKKYMGISRSSFLIAANGKIEHVWEKVNTKTHAQDVLDFINGKTTVTKAPVKKVVAKKSVAKKATPKKTATKKVASKKTTKKSP